MFFLRLPSGDVQVSLFGEAARPVGEARALEMAEAVRLSGADAVAFVSEAWSARPEAVPRHGDAGDALDAQDVLIVAAVDARGNSIALETPVQRQADGTVALGDTIDHADQATVSVFDDVRAIWASAN